jgi:uncharacterized membrane protein
MAEEKTSGAKGAAAQPAPSKSDDNLIAAVGYIITVLVPLFVLFTDKKNNKFLLFHAWQSLMLTVIWVVIWVGLTFVTMIASVATGGIGGFLGCLMLPIGLVALIMFVFCAWKAYQGERYKLPVIGDFADKQAK